ncbi:uncharacterized protein EAE97_011079 [Botrytis byssoidea]|uniref:DUF7730 domain-containing protein n=1 Tax=Botrytis byssoidea TaxID=139641 RepID=A0A9P5LT69_9HELO|nr:uncharacterized protein EAE97_011079 [Botrytis byssoidea]KAF7922337.1 hypothetical protein EAE97_011079 [Botrytis byssoidea]
MNKGKILGFHMLRDLNWPFGQGFHAWGSFLATLVVLFVILVCLSPVFIIMALSRLRKADWNPMSRYRKKKRRERLEQVGREWEEGRKARNKRRLFPNMLQGRERENGLIWNGEVDKQDKSSLYKLPREVRDLIWKEATGEYLVHLTWLEAYRRFDVSRCKGENGNCIGSACQGVRKGKGAKDMWGNVDLLSYLLV